MCRTANQTMGNRTCPSPAHREMAPRGSQNFQHPDVEKYAPGDFLGGNTGICPGRTRSPLDPGLRRPTTISKRPPKRLVLALLGVSVAGAVLMAQWRLGDRYKRPDHLRSHLAQVVSRSGVCPFTNRRILPSHLTCPLGITLPPRRSGSGYLAPRRGPHARLPSEWGRQAPRRFPHTHHGRHCDAGISAGSGGVDHTAPSHPLGQHRCAVCVCARQKRLEPASKAHDVDLREALRCRNYYLRGLKAPAGAFNPRKYSQFLLQSPPRV